MEQAIKKTGDMAGSVAKNMFLANFRITFGFLSMILLANPSGFSFYDFAIKSKVITFDKLVSLDAVACVVSAIGLFMLYFSSRLIVKSVEALKTTFDKVVALVVVVAVTVLQFAFFKEVIMNDLMNLSYVLFVDLTVFCSYVIYSKRADFKDFRRVGADVHSDDEEDDSHDE